MATKATTLAATPVITGTGKAKRVIAFGTISVNAYGLETSRAALVASIGAALGTSPDDLLKAHVRREIVIGTVAAKLPAGELPRGTSDSAARCDFARKLVCQYAAPPQDGVQVRALRAGQLGRRSPVQHRIVRAAEEFASKLLAELGQAGKTNAEASKAKRAPNGKAGKQTESAKGKSAAPDTTSLVKAPVKTRADAMTFINDQSAALAAFAKKHAKLMPSDMGGAVEAFRTACLKAMNAEQERAARADAKKAETES